MKNILFVFLGGGLGSLLRYLMSKWIVTQKGSFPWATLLTNLLGCFIIGLLLGWVLKTNEHRSELYLLLAIGFCGGLTTFSTFSLEGLSLLKTGDYSTFVFYILSSLIGGISFVGIGHYLYNLGNY